MATILSTKKLLENQRSLLLHTGISLVEYNAIKIEPIPFQYKSDIKNAIFTSQNAVLAVENAGLKIQRCFCVGEKTESLLKKKGHTVIKRTEYASELADYLIENHKNDSFHFFCGNIRSDEIPTRLKENQIPFEEIVVYKTTLNPKKFERRFDAILFFSPSGVRSFFELNQPIDETTIAVCIGTTTASEAENFTDNIVISNTTLVESVIAKAVKTLRK